jgi:hypothetical protein
MVLRNGGRLGRSHTKRVRPTGIPTLLTGRPVCITVDLPDPPLLGALLERHGIPVARTVVGVDVELAMDRLAIRAGATSGRLAVAPCRPATRPGAVAPGARLAAIGLATVDHERFAREHGLGQLEAAPHDDLVGARSWRPARSDRLLLLEPSTEGRLAGALARSGEGPLVLYLASGRSPDPVGGRATALGVPGTLLRPSGRADLGVLLILLTADAR